MTVSRGASHHRSVRNVRALIAARGLAPAGRVAVVVIFTFLPVRVVLRSAAGQLTMRGQAGMTTFVHTLRPVNRAACEGECGARRALDESPYVTLDANCAEAHSRCSGRRPPVTGGD